MRFRFVAFRFVGISDLGTATRRRVSSVMRCSGVRAFCLILSFMRLLRGWERDCP